MRHLRSVNKYFLRYKWHLVLGMVFITLSNVFGVLSPQVIRDAIDLVVSNLRTYQSFEGFAQPEGMKEKIREGRLVFGITFIRTSCMPITRD